MNQFAAGMVIWVIMLGSLVFVGLYVENDSVQDFCVDRGYNSSYVTGVEKYCFTELRNGSFIFYEYKQVEYESWRKKQ